MRKPFAITLDVGSSRANHTGAWRTERPVYQLGLPPCQNACPAGEAVRDWLYAAEDGSYEAAWRRLLIGVGQAIPAAAIGPRPRFEKRSAKAADNAVCSPAIASVCGTSGRVQLAEP